MSEDLAKIVNTQNMSKKSMSMGRQRRMNDSDMALPGEGLIQVAEGAVKEGSARAAAEIMDNITGPSNENRAKDMKRSGE